MDKQNYKKFDVIWTSEINIGVIVSEIINVPFFENGAGSKFSTYPLDIQNPEEWKQTFPARIVFDLLKQKYEIVSIYKIDGKLDPSDTNSVRLACVPFDMASGQLRTILGLLQFSDRLEKGADGDSQKYLGL